MTTAVLGIVALWAMVLILLFVSIKGDIKYHRALDGWHGPQIQEEADSIIREHGATRRFFLARITRHLLAAGVATLIAVHTISQLI